MINQVFGETTSFFGGVFLTAIRVFAWIAISILRIAIPIVLFGIVLLGKGIVLFAVLFLVSFWIYWRNIGILQTRLRTTHGFSEFIKEMRLYCYASSDELRFQSVPFSVTAAVQDSQFYRRFIAFVDMRSMDQITIQNFMSLGWIAQVLDSGLTRIVKLAMPIAIQINNILFIPIHMITSLFN